MVIFACVAGVVYHFHMLFLLLLKRPGATWPMLFHGHIPAPGSCLCACLRVDCLKGRSFTVIEGTTEMAIASNAPAARANQRLPRERQ